MKFNTDRLIKSIEHALNEALNETTVKDMALKKCNNNRPEDIAGEILKLIEKTRRSNKDKEIITIKFEIGQCGYGERPFGSGHEERERNGQCYTTHTINVCGVRYELSTLYKIDEICKHLMKALDAQKNNYFYEAEEVSEWHGWSEDKHKFIKTIGCINRICKEFSAVQRYLAKYANFNIEPYMCYDCASSGKRGYYSDKTSSRVYACTDSERCAKFLEAIREVKSTKDKLTVKRTEEHDRSDQEYSRYYETECYGSSSYTIEATVTTPTGKVKATIKL